MPVQTTYSETIAPYRNGKLVDTAERGLITRVAETQIEVGAPLMQGNEADDGCLPFDGSKPLLMGISVSERSLNQADHWIRGEHVRVMHSQGAISVIADVAVSAGDPVHVLPAAGTNSQWSNTGGTTFNAFWETAAAAGELAVLRIR